MSTQGGLQRRRVATASTSSNGFVDPDEDRPTRPNVTPTTPNSNANGDGVREGRVAHAGTAMEGGSKVAYDPRDLVGAGSGGSDDSKVPKLTLLEEILLLGIKDRAVSFRFGGSIACTLQGPISSCYTTCPTQCTLSYERAPGNL
jgi:Golgi phosphoprotein 3